MTAIVVGVVVVVLIAVAAPSIFFAAKRAAEAEAAQFRLVPVWLGIPHGPLFVVRAALPPTCSLLRFEQCMKSAAGALEPIFGLPAVVSALDGARIAVHFMPKWRDAITGQMVAGTATSIEVRVGSDLAALCHELVHVCQFKAGVVDETHASWGPEIYAAIERYEAFARTVRE